MMFLSLGLSHIIQYIYFIIGFRQEDTHVVSLGQLRSVTDISRPDTQLRLFFALQNLYY